MELPTSLWASLPVFAQIYLRPVLLNIHSVEGLAAYFHLLMSEAETTDNEARKLCLETVARYIFEKTTNVSWQTKIIQTL